MGKKMKVEGSESMVHFTQLLPLLQSEKLHFYQKKKKKSMEVLCWKAKENKCFKEEKVINHFKC